MKKLKMILALVLVAALFLSLFAACAKTEKPAADNKPQATDEKPAENKQDKEPANNDAPAADEEPEPAEDEEPASLRFDEEDVNLKMYYFDLRGTGGDFGAHVVDAINEYIVPTYGLHVDIDFFGIGDWISKVQMAIAGGETCDVMPFLITNGVGTMVANNMALPLDDLIAEYAPETAEKMAAYIESCRINGKLYAIPTLKNWVSNGYIIMRKDVLDELGLTEKAQNMSSWSEYEEIMEAVKNKYTADGLYATGNGANSTVLTGQGALPRGDKFSDIERWDSVGEKAAVIYNKDGKLGIYQEQPATVEMYKMLADWNEKGYIWPDTAISNDQHGDECMRQNVTFSTIQVSEIGVEVTKAATIGHELIATQYYPGTITTSGLQSWAIGIPVTADEPEAATFFINLLYNDPKLMNLITWGVEGVDYEVVDGQVKHVEEGHYYEADFLIGDNTILTPIYGNGADHYQKVIDDINNADVSPYVGFALETSELDLLVSQLTAVNDQYSKSLGSGLYTEDMYNEYIGKLHDAGIDEYVGLVQAQLDAWLAAN